MEQLLSMFATFSQLVADAFYDDPRFLTTRLFIFNNYYMIYFISWFIFHCNRLQRQSLQRGGQRHDRLSHRAAEFEGQKVGCHTFCHLFSRRSNATHEITRRLLQRGESSARVEMSGAAGELLRPAAQTHSTLQTTHLRGDE